jgi:hypothetical protein
VARTRERPSTPYLGTPEFDHLARMNTELLSELWILRDRVTVLEHLLEQKAVIERRALDTLVPEGALAEELERERARLVERVVGVPNGGGPPPLEALKRGALA